MANIKSFNWIGCVVLKLHTMFISFLDVHSHCHWSLNRIILFMIETYYINVTLPKPMIVAWFTFHFIVCNYIIWYYFQGIFIKPVVNALKVKKQEEDDPKLNEKIHESVSILKLCINLSLNFWVYMYSRIQISICLRTRTLNFWTRMFKFYFT